MKKLNIKLSSEARQYLSYGVILLFLGVYLIFNSISENKYRKEMNRKLDQIASDTNAVHSRIDALEQDIDDHNAANGEIIQTIILNVHDLKDSVEQENKRLEDEIKRVEQSKKKKKEQQQAVAYTASVSYEGGSGYNHPFRSQGTTNDGNYDYTWYSQRVLPGGGLNIPGRHVDEDGFVRDENGNLCIAARDLDKGTEVDTPFGKAVVYDYCPNGNLDIYTDW